MRYLPLVTALCSVVIAHGVLAQSFSKRYLMALHTCTTNCSNPQTHTARLVESDDGIQWTPVPGVPSFNASVPDLIVRGNKLYLYSPGRLNRYDRENNTWQTAVNVSIRDQANQPVNFVDPSPLIDEQGRIVLFFLRGNRPGEGDPAGCNPYPCTKYFGSAVEVEGTDGAEFVLQAGWRAEIVLQAGVLADPDIFFDGQRYVLYISAGPNTLAYSAPQLHDTYRPIAGLPNGVLTTGGGVPCGHFDATTGQYWTFVHTNEQGRTVIRRAAHDTLERQLLPSQFETIITATKFGLEATASVASPGITVNTWFANPPATHLSAASFRRGALAPESIVTAFGLDLAKTVVSAATLPLPNTLANTTVRVGDSVGNERPAQLFFVSPGQLNYLLPAGTATGTANVTITNADGLVSISAVEIAGTAPGLFAANANGQGVAAAVVLRSKADGTQQFEPVARYDAAQGHFVAVPIELGAESDQVFLLCFGTGFRARGSSAGVSARLGGVNAEVTFAGAQGTLAGVDQLNVRMPRSLAGRGAVNLEFMVDGQTANVVQVQIR
jgi:uncharacterized protein (TIGR03437 family)